MQFGVNRTSQGAGPHHTDAVVDELVGGFARLGGVGGVRALRGDLLFNQGYLLCLNQPPLDPELGLPLQHLVESLPVVKLGQ